MASSSTGHIPHHGGGREVTEDTPPDLLEGTMDVQVILPSKQNVRMTVNRRTPVMDLLIQVTTANKINPGGHIVQVRNEIGRELQYKPSTPIGALDTRTIEIVPKHQVNDYIIAKSKQSAKMPSQPFEHTFRLQVHLPKNQLYVMRVGPKVLLQDVLEEVCQEKDLDISKYEIRHPVNLDEKLSLTNRLGDYGLQQVRVVSKNSRISSSVSSADILALQLKTNGRGSQGHLDSAFNYSRSSVGDSSVSSGSARGNSPSRSDDSRSISPIAILPSKIKLRSSISSDRTAYTTSTPLQTAMLKKSISSNPLPGYSTGSDPNFKVKKRAPPPPPGQSPLHKQLTHTLSQPLTSSTLSEPTGRPPLPSKKEVISGVLPLKPPPISSARSRQSSASDSSGYHEASPSSGLSDQQHELIRNDNRVLASGRKVGTGSLSSLTQPPSPVKPFGMSSTSSTNLTSSFSVSTTSISSTGSKVKRKAPKPPGTPTLQTPLEEELPSIPPMPLERTSVEVQVEVHSMAIADSEPLLKETEKEPPLSQNKSSETLKSFEGTSSESTLAKGEGSETRSMSGSRSSIGSLPPSPLPVEDSRSSPVVSTSAASPPLSPAEVSSTLRPPRPPQPVQRRKKPIPNQSSAPEPELQPQPQPQPKPRSRSLKFDPDPPPIPSPEVSGRKKDPPSQQSSTESALKFGIKVLPDNALQNLLEFRLKNSTGQAGTRVASVSRDGSSDSLEALNRKAASQISKVSRDNFETKNNLTKQIHRPSVGTTEDDGDWDGLEEHLFEQETKREVEVIGQLIEFSSSSSSSESSSESSSSDDDVFIDPRSVGPKSIRVADGRTISATLAQRSQSDSRMEPGSPSITVEEKRKSLNRWKNVESFELNVDSRLDEIHVSSSSSSVQIDIPNQILSSASSTKLVTIPTTNDKVQDMDKVKGQGTAAVAPAVKLRNPQAMDSSSTKLGSGDKHEEASSGSEASYADSGLPATATVTPSPVSLEPDGHDGHEHHSDKSLNSSRRSSIHSSGSDHSECWRELLQAKVDEKMANPPETSDANLPTVAAVTNPITPSPEARLEEIKSNQMKETLFQSYLPATVEPLQPPLATVEPTLAPPAAIAPPLVRAPSDSSQPSSEAEDVSYKQKSRDSRSSGSSTSTMLPTKSDSFTYKGEFEGRKQRRSTSTAAVGISNRRKTTNYTSSSSDNEDGYQERPKQKAISMQNLAKKEKLVKALSPGSNQAVVRSRVPPPPLSSEKVVKATSLAALPSLAASSTDVATGLGDDPKLLETFQVELEQQFEQWKEQFLQRHLGAVPNSSPMESPQKVNAGVIPTEIPTAQSSSSSSSSSESDDGEVNPVVLSQVVESVSSVQEKVEVKSEPQKPEPAPPSQIEIQPSETAMNGVKEPKLREKRPEAPVVMYRYSGPPAINMGTWGERPKRSPVTVKEDTDYIMGMGQNDAKSTSVASRVHGFTGVPPSVQPLNSNRGPSPVASNRRSNVEVKTFKTPAPPTLKERIAENADSNEEEFQRSASATNSLERPRSAKSMFTLQPASNTLDRPGKRTPSPLFMNSDSGKVAAAAAPKEVVIAQPKKSGPSKTASNVNSLAEKINMDDKKRSFQVTQPTVSTKEVNSKPQYGLPAKDVNNSKPEPVQPKKEVNSKPNLQMSTYGESKKSFKAPIIEDKIDAAPSLSRSTSSSSSIGSSFEGQSRPNSVGLEDRKRFFQGVKPAESPTREAPIPASNMKSSIATIQRVFEQRGPTLQKSVSNSSLASSSSGSNVVPSPIPSPFRAADVTVSKVVRGSSFLAPKEPPKIGKVKSFPVPVPPEEPPKLIKGNNFLPPEEPAKVGKLKTFPPPAPSVEEPPEPPKVGKLKPFSAPAPPVEATPEPPKVGKLKTFSSPAPPPPLEEPPKVTQKKTLPPPEEPPKVGKLKPFPPPAPSVEEAPEPPKVGKLKAFPPPAPSVEQSPEPPKVGKLKTFAPPAPAVEEPPEPPKVGKLKTFAPPPPLRSEEPPKPTKGKTVPPPPPPEEPVHVSTGASIRNVGNTAIITVGSEVNDFKRMSVRDRYTQNLKVNSVVEEVQSHSVKISINGDNSTSGKTSSEKKVMKRSSTLTSSTVVVNGGGHGGAEEIILEEKKPVASKNKIKEMQDILAQQKLVLIPPTLSGSGGSRVPPPPPPPPPLNGMSSARSDTMSSTSSRSGSISSESSDDIGSVPATPSSPLDGRAGVLHAIKNSKGNFGLKKTSSSAVLLK